MTCEDMDVEDVNHRELMDILVPDNRGVVKINMKLTKNHPAYMLAAKRTPSHRHAAKDSECRTWRR